MSDVGWGSDHLEPPKKRKIPLWVLGCGGGCMFAIGALVVAAVVMEPRVKHWIEDLFQPEVQWPRLDEVLPFDERPAGVTIGRWPVPNIDIWRLESKADDLFVFVLAAPLNSGEGPWGQWMLDPKQSPMFASQAGEFESTEGTLVVQGRELRSVRFTRTSEPAPTEALKEVPDPMDSQKVPPQVKQLLDLIGRESFHGNGLDLDVTPEGSLRRVLVWFVRGTHGETISDEQAKAFLAPFKIGPQR